MQALISEKPPNHGIRWQSVHSLNCSAFQGGSIIVLAMIVF